MTLAISREKKRKNEKLREGVEEEKGFDSEDRLHNQRRRTREGNAGTSEPTPKRSKPNISGTESGLHSTSRSVSFADPLLTGLE